MGRGFPLPIGPGFCKSFAVGVMASVHGRLLRTTKGIEWTKREIDEKGLTRHG